MFDKQSLKGGQTIKHCLTSKSKQSLSRDGVEKVQKYSLLDANIKCWTSNVFDMAKRPNILLEKQISNG